MNKIPRSWKKAEIFSSPELSRTALESTQPRIQWVLGLFPGITRPEREFGLSSPSSVHVKNEYTSVLPVCLHGIDRGHIYHYLQRLVASLVYTSEPGCCTHGRWANSSFWRIRLCAVGYDHTAMQSDKLTAAVWAFRGQFLTSLWTKSSWLKPLWRWCRLSKMFYHITTHSPGAQNDHSGHLELRFTAGRQRTFTVCWSRDQFYHLQLTF